MIHIVPIFNQKRSVNMAMPVVKIVPRQAAVSEKTLLAHDGTESHVEQASRIPI